MSQRESKEAGQATGIEGSTPPEPVENRPNVSTVEPGDYPDPAAGEAVDPPAKPQR